jgi:CDP-glycerol glycerophosphotransferase (TagB/SpsB family)
VLYAPTWEGTHAEMDYSSVASMGQKIVQKILDTPGYRLIYRPHPGTGKRLPEVKKAHLAISKMVKEHPRGLIKSEGDINAIFEHCQIAIFDNSAVAVDYLATQKPMFMTNWQKTEDADKANPSLISQAATKLDTADMEELIEKIQIELNEDPLKAQRDWVKNQFLGPFKSQQQESTVAFVDAIKQICEECECLNIKRSEVKNK